MTATVMYNKTSTAGTVAARPRSRITQPATGGRPTNDPKGTLVAVRLSGRQVQILERRSHREDTGLSEALRRCLDEWAVAQDAARTHTKEATRKQRVVVGIQPARRRTRRETK